MRVFKNGILRRILGPMRDQHTGGCRKLHNKEFHKLYSSPNIVRIIKSRRIRWAGDTVWMDMRNAYRIWLESLKT